MCVNDRVLIVLSCSDVTYHNQHGEEPADEDDTLEDVSPHHSLHPALPTKSMHSNFGLVAMNHHA